MSVNMTFAQQNMFVVDNNGNVNALKISSVNYSTFNASKWFTITYGDIESATTTSFSTSCTIVFNADADVKNLTSTRRIGICYSKDNTTPTVEDNCESLGSGLKYYQFSLSSLIPGTTYYYRVYVKLNNGVFYGNVAKAKTLGTKPND